MVANIALPSLPLPQFTYEDFGERGLSLFNNTIAAVVARINALAPAHPNINLKVQFLPQFLPSDFTDPELPFLNSQMSILVKNVNSLSGSTLVPAVQLVQLKLEDFQKPGLPVVAQYLTNIINRVNAL